MSIQDIEKMVESQLGIHTIPSFSIIAPKLGYNKSLNSGALLLVVKPKTSIWNLVKLMVKYQKETVDWVLHAGWYRNDITISLSEKFGWNAKDLIATLNSDEQLKEFGSNSIQWPELFIPNTYNLKRKIKPRDFLNRMAIEANRFWLDKNRAIAISNSRMSHRELIALAAIVTKESNSVDEFGKIASVYKNRLAKGMLLQADPTVVFARGHAGRVLAADLKIESPYNTYLHFGLPIGPICIPNPQAIDSCLMGVVYPYFYFCAKADLTPRHDFAIGLEQHNKNARALHKALDNIKKQNP